MGDTLFTVTMIDAATGDELLAANVKYDELAGNPLDEMDQVFRFSCTERGYTWSGDDAKSKYAWALDRLNEIGFDASKIYDTTVCDLLHVNGRYVTKFRRHECLPAGMPAGFYEEDWLIAFGADQPWEELDDLDKLLGENYEHEPAFDYAMSIIHKHFTVYELHRGQDEISVHSNWGPPSGYMFALNSTLAAEQIGDARRCAMAELQTFSSWANGNVFYLDLVKVCQCCGQEIDADAPSLGGFYGADDAEVGAQEFLLEYAPDGYTSDNVRFEVN